MVKPKSDVWYKAQPMGIHTIEKTTKFLMSAIGEDDKFFSNTSLRRTAQTRLVESGIPAMVIQKKTGRISSDLDYLVASDNYEKQMSAALYGEEVESPQEDETNNAEIVKCETVLPSKDSNASCNLLPVSCPGKSELKLSFSFDEQKGLKSFNLQIPM